MSAIYCDHCGEPLLRRSAFRYQVPTSPDGRAALDWVWLCRDCRSLYNSPLRSFLMFVGMTLLILFSVPAIVAVLLGIAHILSH